MIENQHHVKNAIKDEVINLSEQSDERIDIGRNNTREKILLEKESWI